MKKTLFLIFVVSLFLLFLLNGCMKGCIKEDVGKPLEKKGEDSALFEELKEEVKKEIPTEIPKEGNGEITLTMHEGETRLIDLNGVQHKIRVLTIASSKEAVIDVDDKTSDVISIRSTTTISGLSITVGDMKYSAKTGETSMITFVVKTKP